VRAQESDHVGRLAAIRDECLQHEVGTFEASADAEAEWIRTTVENASMRRKALEECTPGYYNDEGKPSAAALRGGVYTGAPVFIWILERWREAGDLSGLELRRAAHGMAEETGT
jgi:hypothetical protein